MIKLLLSEYSSFFMRKQRLFFTVTISLSIGLSITLFSHHERDNFQTKVELKTKQFEQNIHKSRKYRTRHRDPHDHRHREMFRRRPSRDPIIWCKPLSFQDRDDEEERTRSRTALVSFPGSGNTWVSRCQEQ